MPDISYLDAVRSLSALDPIMYQYFDSLLNHRTVLLNQEIDECFYEAAVLPLIRFEEDNIKDKVTLILNTPGGSIADGLVLCNIIDNYTKPLEIIVPSYACSMGTIILCSGNKNPNVVKKCYPFSFGLLHSGQTFVQGESTSVDDIIEFNKNLDNQIKEYIISNTKITEEEYMAHHRKQWYQTSFDLLRNGLIDEIMGVDNAKNKDEAIGGSES